MQKYRNQEVIESSKKKYIKKKEKKKRKNQSPTYTGRIDRSIEAESMQSRRTWSIFMDDFIFIYLVPLFDLNDF